MYCCLCLYVCLSCLYVCLHACLSASPSICLSAYLSACVCVVCQKRSRPPPPDAERLPLWRNGSYYKYRGHQGKRYATPIYHPPTHLPLASQHPVKPKVYGKSELARWLMGLDVRREHSFREDMFHGGLFRKVKRQPRPKCATNSSDGCGEVREIWGSSTAPNMELYSHPLFSSPSVERVLQEDKDETEEPPPPGELSRTFATNALREIDAMEHGAMMYAADKVSCWVGGGSGEWERKGCCVELPCISSLYFHGAVEENQVLSGIDHAVPVCRLYSTSRRG